MAIGTPPVLQASGGASAGSVALASFTPPANSLLIAFAMARGSAAGIPTISDDLGGTWTPVAAGEDTGNILGRLFYQVIGASPAAMVVTVASASAGQVGGHVMSFTGAGTDFSNYVFDKTNVTGDAAITMGAFAAGSTCIGFTAVNSGSALTPPSGYTELYDAAIATNLRSTVVYDSSSPATAMTWGLGTGTEVLVMGLEIKEPAGGSIYDKDIAETAAAAETINRSIVAVGALAEVLTVAETQSTLGVFGSTTAETLTVVDALTGGLVQSGAVAEVLTVIETINRSIVAVGDLAETLNAVAAQSTLGVFESTTAEILTVAETQTGIGVFSKSLAETITVVDALTGGLIQTGAVAEVLVAVETINRSIVAVGALAETLAVAETQAGLGVFGKSLAEVLAAAETSAGSIPVFNTIRARAMIVG